MKRSDHFPLARRGRATVTPSRSKVIRAELRAWRESLPEGMERDTSLMPRLIAETVCDEVSQFLEVEMPARYAVWLEAKARRCYSAHRHFYKLMQADGNVPRDRLYMFMRHWLASFLHLERPDLFHRLPISFGDGKRLPYGRHSGIGHLTRYSRWSPPPRDWEAARVTRHRRWAWLKQIEAAGVA